MKKLWNRINSLRINGATKSKIFIAITVVLSSIVGGLLWMLFGREYLPGGVWLICFMGYPALFIGYFHSIIYLFNHEFKNW